MSSALQTNNERGVPCNFMMAEKDIETSFQEAIDAGKINGALMSATDTRGNFVYEKSMGKRTLISGDQRPNQLDDVLYLASATKLLTTIAALQCVEDGLLTLTGDLSSIAPELAAKQVITGFSQDTGDPILEPQVHSITLEMLLTHSSGITYHFGDPVILRWRDQFNKKPQGSVESSKMLVEELFNYPLKFQPGEGWMYGAGLDWAGRIVERVTGKSLGAHMHQRIFGPLGIVDAQFYPVTREDLRSRLVDLNPDDPDVLGRAVLGEHTTMNGVTKGDFGGHGLFMTAKDYVKVLHSLLANDGKILNPASVNDMFEHHLSPEATKSHRSALASPMGNMFRVGTSIDSIAGHGLGGLLTLQDVDGWYGERTLSWGGGFTFAWFVDRKNDLCGVGAILASVPLDYETADSLKQTFRHDIYRKHAMSKHD